MRSYTRQAGWYETPEFLEDEDEPHVEADLGAEDSEDETGAAAEPQTGEEEALTDRQRLGEAIFALFLWLSDEDMDASVEDRSRTMHLKVLGAVCVLAPKAAKKDPFERVSQLTGVPVERVREIAEDAMRGANTAGPLEVTP